MRGFLSFLNLAYFPFIGFLGFLQFSLAVFFLAAAILSASELSVFYAFLAVVFFVLFSWYLLPMYYFFTSKPDPQWIMEVKITRDDVPELYEIVDEVAKRCRLPRADEIRLSPTTEAAAYQTKKGRNVLLLGALTIASFPVNIVEAIIAHELSHMGLGDTAMLREMRTTRMMMIYTRHHLLFEPWFDISFDGFIEAIPILRWQLGMRALVWGIRQFFAALRYLHPFLWATFFYQWIFNIAFAAASREQEYEADQASVDQSGAKDTATALFYVHVTPLIPEISFHDMMMAIAKTRDFEKRAFTSQVREIRRASKSDWKKAMRRALKQTTRLFDDHPSLVDRLKAIGVEPDEAFAWAWQMEGEPTSELVDTWDELERKLTIRLVAPYLAAIESKHELAALMSRSRSRSR